MHFPTPRAGTGRACVLTAAVIAVAACAGDTPVPTETTELTAVSTDSLASLSAPRRVTDLAITAATNTSLTISFTQVSNGAGGAANYDVRFIPGAMTWWLATSVSNGSCAVPLAGTKAGQPLTCTIEGLEPNTQYAVQVVAFRGTLNVNAKFGALSNVATATTSTVVQPPPPPPPPTNLFWEERFDDAMLGARGWYDNTAPQLSSTEHTTGSTRSLMFRWAPGATTPVSGGAMRKKFPASNSLYVTYDVKYSSNYTGSGRSYHPHEFYVLSSMDGDWDGLSNNWMTLYIEQNWTAGSGGRPRLAMQDNKAINTSLGSLPNNLLGTTENRSTGGCNGMSEVGMVSECFAFAPWYNDKQITGPVSFQSGRWHHVEVYFQLNSVVNGIGQPNGIMQYWVDGALKIDRRDIMFRTGARSSLQWNQFVIAPYMGDGSPVDQTMWIDNLWLASAR
jgi:hypothetical protein